MYQVKSMRETVQIKNHVHGCASSRFGIRHEKLSFRFSRISSPILENKASNYSRWVAFAAGNWQRGASMKKHA